MQLISKEPLTTDELKKLHFFLSSPHDKATPMSLTASHGFLTAILSAPDLIMPSKWQPILFGGNPSFDSMEQASSIIELIGRFNNQISNMLRSNDFFEPLIFNTNSIIPYQDASFSEIGEWCKGYVNGIKLSPEWYSEDKVRNSVLPFAIYSGEINIKGFKNDKGNIIEDDLPSKEKMKKIFPAYIKDIFNAWRGDKKFVLGSSSTVKKIYEENNCKFNHDPFQLNEPIINSNKIGRNEQCPCGSGKKYKKCCIASNQPVH